MTDVSGDIAIYHSSLPDELFLILLDEQTGYLLFPAGSVLSLSGTMPIVGTRFTGRTGEETAMPLHTADPCFLPGPGVPAGGTACLCSMTMRPR